MREKLIELLDGTGYFINKEVASYVADKLISHGVTVQEWIPASEPPKDTYEYWIAYKAGGDYYYSTGYYDGKCWRSALTHNKIPVTHWMPLPEAPTTCHMTSKQPPKGE